MTALFSFCNCSKQSVELPKCDKVCLLSDKYTSDSTFIRTDTLWKDDNICGEDLIRLKKEQDFWVTLCADMTIEHWRYVVGNTVTHPAQLKF
jgi:hypothetical protein